MPKVHLRTLVRVLGDEFTTGYGAALTGNHVLVSSRPGKVVRHAALGILNTRAVVTLQAAGCNTGNLIQ